MDALEKFNADPRESNSLNFRQQPNDIRTPENEILIFSFDTENGKKVWISKDTTETYLVYRFGSREELEFEFPESKKNNWSEFTFSSYFRGGGSVNAGLELYSLFFTHKGFKYEVYDDYSAESNQNYCGVNIIELATQLETRINGIADSRKGTLRKLENSPVNITKE